jgi:hypothetical protein
MERVTREQFWQDITGRVTDKQAELTGTKNMPHSVSDETANAPRSKKFVEKSAQDQILKNLFGVKEGEPEKTAASVTQDSAPPMHLRTDAHHYALPELQRYPLDGFDQVKAASDYFNEWHREMEPRTRREYCRNLVKRAYDLGVEVSGLAENYGAEDYAEDEEVKTALDYRRNMLEDEAQLATLEKIAHVRQSLQPDEFAEVLTQFDEASGLVNEYGRNVPDAFLSTFAKHAEAGPEETIIMGQHVVPVRDLEEFSRIGQNIVKDRFGEDFAKEFTKSPKSIFDSLPQPQKVILLRMVSGLRAQGRSASVS